MDWTTIRRKLSLILLAAALATIAGAQANVLTQHNDIGRTGQNLNEVTLTTSNVGASTFGELYQIAVDGQVYAQPLVMSSVNIGGKVRNVLFVATQQDSLYCFDADTGAQLWKDSFVNPPSVVPVPYQDLTGAPNINPVVGILSTPVIDPGSNTIYIVTKTLEGPNTSDSSYIQRLRAIDIFTGKDKVTPVVLAATVPGTGDGTDGTNVSYSNRHENQRPALLLVNGVVYVAAASHGDHRPYHGWVLAYNAATLAQVAVFCESPNGIEGGFWQSGQGPTVDADGNIYLMSGNGTFTADPSLGNGIDYGDSFIKLRGGNLTVDDYFTPFNQANLAANDADLGSAGVLMIPNTTLLTGAGKQGILYLMENYSMGHFNTAGNDGQIVESFKVSTGEVHGSPVYWNGPSGAHIYLAGTGDSVKSFAFANGSLGTTPLLSTDETGHTLVQTHGPGGFLSISANGNKSGTGILWGSFGDTANSDGSQSGILRAFDATTMQEIWNSKMNAARDNIQIWPKFCPPTIANGKVYESTFSGTINVYGLLNTGGNPPPPPTNLQATAGANSVALLWNASTGAQTYNVKRSLSSGTGYVTIKSGLTVTNFADTGLTAGTTYYYVVTAVNAKGESGNSNEASATPGSSNSVTLTTIADTYTHSTTPTSAYGLGPTLRTKFWSSTDQRITYIKFDISKLGTPVNSAKLRVYGDHLTTASVTVSAYGVANTSWVESTMDWANQPPLGALISSTSVSPTAQYYEWDVTSYIQSQVAAGATLVTLALQETVRPTDGGITEFNSRQNTAGNPPVLVVSTGNSNPPIINLPNGFNANDGIQLNGTSSLNGTRLQLTSGLAKQIGTAFYATPVPVTAFHTQFSFQLTTSQADGITFCIQGVGPTAMGQGGGALGYGEIPTALGTGIGKSVAIKFDLFDNGGEGPDSTGIFTNGAYPTVPATDLTPSGVNLHSGDIMNVSMVYNGTTLNVKITDATTGGTASQAYTVNIGSIVGTTGYVGFTGSTGFHTAVQQIASWVYSKG